MPKNSCKKKSCKRSIKRSKRNSRSYSGEKLKLISIKKSPKKDKKLVARFSDGKEVHFGAKGYSDFTKHKDEARKQRYIIRHKKRENWNDPQTKGSLSLYILWNKPTIEASVKDYKNKFHL